MSAVTDGAMEQRRDWKWRLLRWLGFRWARIPYLDDREGYAPGYLGVTIFTYWGFLDRLRILATGRTVTEVSLQTDAPVKRLHAVTDQGVVPTTWVPPEARRAPT